MSLSFGLSPWLLVLCLAAALALTFWSYRRTTPPVPAGYKAVLMALRALALGLVLFLLFDPVWRQLDRTERPPVLAVLVDDSESLRLAADTSAGGVGPAVRSALDALAPDRVPGEVHYYAFSQAARRLPDAAPLDSVAFTGARTDIARALEQVRDALQAGNLQGVLLVSDGRYNTGRNPLHAAERYPVPIHTLVLGDTTARRDVQVRRVTTNEIAYEGLALPVQVGLRSDDMGGAQVTVTVARDGQVLDRTTVTLPDGTAEIPVDLSVTPTGTGLHRYVAAVTRLDGEATYENNEQPFTVRVLERKKRVLLLASAPGPDVSALRQLLAQDDDLEVTSRVQKDAGTFYEGALPPDLAEMDLIVLAGYPGEGAAPSTLSRLRAAAEADVPLLFVLTRDAEPGLVRQLADVLPVQLAAPRPSFVEAQLDPTPEGLRHPVLAVEGVPAEALRRLPPLLYNESRWTASPDARVLATSRLRGVALDDPLLVVRSRSGRRSAALLGAGTWRWLTLPDDLDALEPYWPGLLTNLVQWLTTRVDDRLVRVRPVRDTFGGGEPVQLTGQVYDESLNPVDDASVEVQMTTPEGTRYPYTMEAVGSGRYVLDVGTLPEGAYTFEATAQRGDVTVGADEGAFAVGRLTLEYKETRADAALMRQIAARSGGTAYAPSSVEALAPQLQASAAFVPLTLEQERETDLRRLYVFLAVVLACLTLEWFLRKRAGMV